MEKENLLLKKVIVLWPPGAIKHNELSCSDDFEALELLSPAKHDTVKV
jgi:hypothetical protein